jgi:hypothetical protein
MTRTKARRFFAKLAPVREAKGKEGLYDEYVKQYRKV